MAGNEKGDERWTIRIPDGPQTELTPQQRAVIANLPEVKRDDLTVFFEHFEKADELEEFFQNFPMPQEPGETEKTA